MHDLACRLIAEFEGCRLAPYRDMVGCWTIGYGLTTLGGQPVTVHTRALTRAQAEALLSRTVGHLTAEVQAMTWRPMTDGQCAAMTSFAYNLGLSALRGSALLRLFNAGDVQSAAGQFASWCLAGGEVAPGLVRRRARERDVFLGASGTEAMLPQAALSHVVSPHGAAPGEAVTADALNAGQLRLLADAGGEPEPGGP